MKRILVLSSAESDYTVRANEKFVQEIASRIQDVQIDAIHYSDVVLYIESGLISARIVSSGLDVADYDLVYFKSFYRYSEIALAIANFLQMRGVEYICHELDTSISFSKLTQYSRLALHGAPIIPTVFVERSNWRAGLAEIEQRFGFPVIFKAIDGKGGDANFYVNSAEELLAHVDDSVGDFVAQQPIPNTHDLRVLVAGGEVKLIIKRQRHDQSTHLNNTSKGADATLVPVGEIDSKIIDISLATAAEFGRDIAGVDVMTNSETGEHVILEVNASPQVATGAFTDEKLDVYAGLFTKLLG